MIAKDILDEVIPVPELEDLRDKTVAELAQKGLDGRDLLLEEMNRIKPARTLLHLEKEQRYQAPLLFAAAKAIGRQMTIRQE